MSEYTPGPWINEGLQVITDTAFRTIISVADSRSAPQKGIANARLIAAAPELLEACKEFVASGEFIDGRSAHAYGKILAAITKAEGEK